MRQLTTSMRIERFTESLEFEINQKAYIPIVPGSLKVLLGVGQVVAGLAVGVFCTLSGLMLCCRSDVLKAGRWAFTQVPSGIKNVITGALITLPILGFLYFRWYNYKAEESLKKYGGFSGDEFNGNFRGDHCRKLPVHQHEFICKVVQKKIYNHMISQIGDLRSHSETDPKIIIIDAENVNLYFKGEELNIHFSGGDRLKMTPNGNVEFSKIDFFKAETSLGTARIHVKNSSKLTFSEVGITSTSNVSLPTDTICIRNDLLGTGKNPIFLTTMIRKPIMKYENYTFEPCLDEQGNIQYQDTIEESLMCTQKYDEDYFKQSLGRIDTLYTTFCVNKTQFM